MYDKPTRVQKNSDIQTKVAYTANTKFSISLTIPGSRFLPEKIKSDQK